MVFETETASTVSNDDKLSSSPTTLGNLREKLARALSPSSSRTNPKQGAASADERESARSVSRGREYVSTGRGGAGNFVRGESETRGRVSRERDGDERGRELSPSQKVTHTGRGGAGNVRSPSREPGAIREELIQEREAIEAAKAPADGATFSTGRGGLGNIVANKSPSRERTGGRSVSRDPPAGKRYTSSGRGGRGNIHTPPVQSQQELEKLDEDERVAAGGADHHELHSTGRGGAGNLTSAEDADAHPTAEVPTEEGIHSHGKGGYGNIIDTTEHKKHTGLGEIWDKVTHPSGHKK